MLQDHGGEVWEVHFSYSHLLYLLPSLFSDDGSSFFTLPNTKQDQLDQLVSISGLWNVVLTQEYLFLSAKHYNVDCLPRHGNNFMVTMNSTCDTNKEHLLVLSLC